MSGHQSRRRTATPRQSAVLDPGLGYTSATVVRRPRPIGGAAPAAAITAALIVRVTASADSVHGVANRVFDDVLTYLAGARVHGVAVLDDRIEVHIVVVGSDAVAVAEAVRRMAGSIFTGPVEVIIDDLVIDDLAAPAGEFGVAVAR
ncbi:hypothetical protein ACFWPK_32075 [Nocardia sp. NPDC058519]|uniref:hypothetical protein n=1 Tax=Nocardia sp. NPDC058519 TaxID=3346535 RepID=UPI003657A1C7